MRSMRSMRSMRYMRSMRGGLLFGLGFCIMACDCAADVPVFERDSQRHSKWCGHGE
jgi:hypothetical protein